MKKIILGTTALIAVSALTMGAASAAEKKAVEKIKLSLSGYLQTSFVAADYSGSAVDRLPTNMRLEGEVHFRGKTTLDNGLEFGVNIQLEAYTNGDQMDETFTYVEGAFGRVNLGSEDGASYLMHYGSKNPSPGFGLNSPNALASGMSWMTTSTNEIWDKDNITYFTPRFSGVQLGATYTPDADWETGSGGNGPYSAVGTEGAADEAFSFGANYVNKVGEANVAASFGYQLVTRTIGDNTEEFSVGTRIGYAGFNVGAGYKFSNNDAAVKDLERHDYNASVNYGQGPWSIGVQYAGVNLDNAGDGDINAFQVSGSYNLGPGITVFGGAQHYRADGDLADPTFLGGAIFSGGGAGAGDRATIFFVGTALSF